MSLWSTALSTRWAEDVAAASNDVDDGSRLPTPVVHQDSNDRRSQTGTPLKSVWRRFRQRMKSTSTTRRAAPVDDHPPHPLLNITTPGGTSKRDETEIDEIVVDRCWSKEYASSSHASVVDDSDSTADDFEERYNPTITVEHRGFWASNRALATVRWVLWPNIQKFFNSRFPDPNLELEYQKEVWTEGKRLAELASIFLIVNWLMAVLSIPKPNVIADKVRHHISLEFEHTFNAVRQIFYYGVREF